MYAYIEGDNLDEVWEFFHGTSVGFVSPKVGDNLTPIVGQFLKPPPPPPGIFWGPKMNLSEM
jgi:hypothetical protein